MKNVFGLAMASVALALAAPAYATPETMTSPTGGTLPSGVTQVGGLVVDLQGTNGTRVVSQLAASQLYRGYSYYSENPVPGVASGNPLLMGTQSGYTPAVVAALGGGISSAAFRITLFDGDTAPYDFDFNQNTFSVNGVNLGNWSDVTTYRTNSAGTALYSTGTGFGDGILSTGFFSLTNASSLAALYSSLSNGSMAFRLTDSSPRDNYFDFTQGVEGGLINVGQGPVVTPPTGAVPEPGTWAMMLLGFFALGIALRRSRSTQATMSVRYS